MGCLKLSYYENFYLSQRRPLRKMKDQEKNCVSLLYFGARYYNSEVSVWLSVDPFSDKYPSMSPYMYCAGSPVMLKDKDGRDWYKSEHGLRNDFHGNICKNGDYLHPQTGELIDNLNNFIH